MCLSMSRFRGRPAGSSRQHLVRGPMDSSEPQKRQRLSILFPQEIYQQLSKQCAREGVSLAELVTDLLARTVLEQSLEEGLEDYARSA